MRKPELEFWSYDADQIIRDRMHAHPYWQLEVILKGTDIVLYDEHHSYPVQPGGMMLIPPLVRHKFLRKTIPNEIYSFKFSLKEKNLNFRGSPSFLSAELPFSKWIRKLMVPFFERKSLDSEKKEELEYLLLMLLEYWFYHTREVESGPAFFERLDMLVKTDRHEVNVQSAAEKLGLTVPRLKYQFRQESLECPDLGNGTSVKRYLDRKQVELIDRYLDYSNYSIAQIAVEMRFPDPYSLSHFYRRMTGKSPSQKKLSTGEKLKQQGKSLL